MDKLKPFLIACNRNRFWILCGVLLVTGIVSWYSATEAADAKFAADKQRNQSAFSSLELFNRGGVNHPPNAHYKTAVEEVRVQLEGQVVEAWKNLFERQRKVLTVNPRLNELANACGLPVTCGGVDFHPHLQFSVEEPALKSMLATLYIQEMAKRGCHGYPAFYLNAAQNNADVEQTLDAARETFTLMADGLQRGRIDDLLEA